MSIVERNDDIYDDKEPSVCDDCEISDGWECHYCCSKCYEDYGECPNPDCDPMDIQKRRMSMTENERLTTECCGKYITFQGVTHNQCKQKLGEYEAIGTIEEFKAMGCTLFL